MVPRSGIIGTAQGQSVSIKGRLHNGALPIPICRSLSPNKLSYTITSHTVNCTYERGAGSINQDTVPNGYTGLRVREHQSRGCVFRGTNDLDCESQGWEESLRPHLTGARSGVADACRATYCGFLFETNRATCYSPRRIQYIVKETAEQAQITKRVYPHLLRHSVATTLLGRGMPTEQIQKFLGHSKLETTQLYAEASTAMMQESYQRALSR